jgi:hypothetical protein
VLVEVPLAKRERIERVEQLGYFLDPHLNCLGVVRGGCCSSVTVRTGRCHRRFAGPHGGGSRPAQAHDSRWANTVGKLKTIVYGIFWQIAHPWPGPLGGWPVTFSKQSRRG